MYIFYDFKKITLFNVMLRDVHQKKRDHMTHDKRNNNKTVINNKVRKT